jgi:hypothetical protein
MASSPHSAAGPALGYHYQTQWPLLALLDRRPGERPDAAITLELHDDVAWESGTPTELIQAKHHLRTTRTLGDMDTDWWRTIRAWMSTGAPGDPNGPLLTMITTLTAAVDSAAAALRPPSPDTDAARERLEAAAALSAEKQFATVRKAFLDLDAVDRTIFVSRMRVLDARPNIADLDGAVRDALGRVLPRDRAKADLFMKILWGWWNERAMEMLRGDRRNVGALEVDAYVDDLRDTFGKDRLPTSVLITELNLEELSAHHADRPFVHQLRWIEVPGLILQTAIVDYYRAYVQQTEWLDADLIGYHEIEEFERSLVDEWDREFAWMLSELGEEPTKDEKIKLGRLLLRKTLDQTSHRVRVRYDEPFFSRGKHHELADAGGVGWHMDFRTKLDALLLERAA